MHRILLCACLTCLLLPAAERWEIQYFYDKNDSAISFTDLQFTSAKNGIAIGAIVEERRRKPVTAVTTDGGITWQLLPLKEHGLSLFFLHERAGWMVGQKGGLWKTADGGRTWTSAKLSGIRAKPLRVFFLDESRGWLLCTQKQVYSTTDGGGSWQLLAASKLPDVPEDRSIYTGAACYKQEVAIITGWSRLSNRRSRLPDWMEPEAIPIGNTPTTSIILHSSDGGKNWKFHLLPDRGEILRTRISGTGAALLLIRRPDALNVPTEIAILDIKTLRGKSVYGDKNRWLTDVAFAGPGRAFAAAIDQEGRTPFPAIPAKLKVLTSTDTRQWTEMDVDYRAEARNAVLAAPDDSHAWIATDTGMILRWVKDEPGRGP